MKRFISLTVIFLLTACYTLAKEVTVEQARQYATAFMQARGWRSTGVADVQAAGTADKAYYIINLAPQGWIILAADDVVTPILGYSKSGALDCTQLPENMRYILDEYEQEIRRTVRKATLPHRGWSTLTGTVTRASGQEIAPLIQVNWNQSTPYNAYCPQQKALVGCVAVAMAQAMSVQRWPARPQGSVSYTSPNYGGLSINFDNEMAYNWDDIFSAARNYDEVARLLYHAGMSVRMSYGEDGSGIPSNEVSRISEALKNNFSYPDDVQYIWRDYYDGDWEQLLVNELNAGRAIVYNAIDTQHSSGHSFNLDGYDGEGRVHVNWGWGGYGNGYFTVNNLRDQAMQMDYDANHVAVIGIGAPDQVLKSISLSNNHIEEGLPEGAVVGKVLVNGEEIKSGYEVSVHGTYDSKSGTYKSVPFELADGMLKTTEQLSAQTARWDVEITAYDPESKASLTQGFRITVEAWKSLEETTTLSFDRASRSFLLKTKHNVTYTITDQRGTLVRQGLLEPLPELAITPADLATGSCFIELKCADETKKFQLISKQN